MCVQILKLERAQAALVSVPRSEHKRTPTPSLDHSGEHFLNLLCLPNSCQPLGEWYFLDNAGCVKTPVSWSRSQPTASRRAKPT
jgi:hypothetical protein